MFWCRPRTIFMSQFNNLKELDLSFLLELTSNCHHDGSLQLYNFHVDLHIVVVLLWIMVYLWLLNIHIFEQSNNSFAAILISS